MNGSNTWWVKQGIIVGTALLVWLSAYFAFTSFRSGAVISAAVLSIVGLLIGIGGIFAWYRYSRKEKVELLEQQIYGPK